MSKVILLSWNNYYTENRPHVEDNYIYAHLNHASGSAGKFVVLKILFTQKRQNIFLSK